MVGTELLLQQRRLGVVVQRHRMLLPQSINISLVSQLETPPPQVLRVVLLLPLQEGFGVLVGGRLRARHASVLVLVDALVLLRPVVQPVAVSVGSG